MNEENEDPDASDRQHDGERDRQARIKFALATTNVRPSADPESGVGKKAIAGHS